MELCTNDLLLRTVTKDDADEVARMWDSENGRVSAEEAQAAIDEMEENHKQNGAGHIHHLCLAVYEKGDKNTIIGWCGLDGTTEGKLHIFYSIDKSRRNRGYAAQCAKALVSYAFSEAKVLFVNGGCHKNNTASFKVMQKAGMNQTGFEPNGDPLFYMDEAMWLKLKED